MTYLQESISNSYFRGTCINGAIVVSGYYDENAETITLNTLRGSVVISKGVVVGYIANNTAWASGGFTAYLAYNNRTESGLLDLQFVFPAGRLSFNTMQIETLAQGRTEVGFNMAIESLAQGRVDYASEIVSGIIVRSNIDNNYDNETALQLPSFAKIRAGVRVNT